MRLITSLIGIAGLSFAILAVAQEQQTASPAPEEKPSTTVEQATAPSPETTTTAKAPEQTPAQQKEKPAAPAANQKRPVAAKAPSSPATAPSKNMSVEATLKNNENRWEASYGAHDTKDGKPFDRAFRFTDTWMQRGGQWQCVASHVMKIKG